MFQVAVLAVVLVVVFALKTASILMATEDVVSKSASFSWMTVKPEDAIVPPAETVGAAQSASAPAHVYSARPRIA